jgi:Fe-S-cluster containining protein
LDLAAGDFSTWLEDIRGAIRSGEVVDVPCGECTACCTSSQFVHVAPDETDTLAHIPRELLFPAPGRPEGHVVLGYDERGHCPMFADGGCSIYEHRPRTCRSYDCRVLPAAAFEDDEDVPVAIGERASRWRFTYATPAARVQHEAVEAAATYIAEHPDVLPPNSGRPSLTRVAALAIDISDLFLAHEGDAMTVATPDAAVITAALARRGV